MAEINFGLIDTQAPARIANALMPSPEQQGAQALQVMQMQQAARQGQVLQMQLQKMKQDAESVAEFSRRVAKLGGPSDPMEIAQAYLALPDAESKRFGLELLRKTQDVAKFTSIMGRRLPGADMTAPPAAPMSPSVALEPGSFGADVAARRAADLQRTNMLPGAAQPPGVNAMAGGNAAQIAFKQQQRDDLIGIGTTQSIAAAKALDADIALLAKEPSYQTVPGVGLVNPRDRSVVMPSVEPTDPVIKQYNFAVNQGFKGTLLDYKREIAKAGRAQAQPRPEQPPVAVVDPATGKTVYVSREEALRQRMTPAGANEPKPLTAQQQLKAKETRIAQSGVVKSADTAAAELETLADNLLGNPGKKIKPNPGLGGITGYMGLVPSLPNSDARSAQQQLDTFKGKVMAFGRQLAVQQGKLGNMAVSEWKFISDAVEKIDPLAKNFDLQLRDVVRQAKDFAVTKRETFDETYDSTTPASAPGATGIDALLNKYK